MVSYEAAPVVLLLLWAVGSVLFLFPSRRIRRTLKRVNHSRMFVPWELFGANHDLERAGTHEVLFRDRHGEEGGEWQVGASGHCWSWRAWLWLPQRFEATAVQNLGGEIRQHLHRVTAEDPLVVDRLRRLAAHVRRRHPRPCGTTRELWLVRRFSCDGTMQDVLVFAEPSGRDEP